MKRATFLTVAVIFWAWLAFRFASDWPRGVAASGEDVADLGRQLSYYGLVAWLALATPFIMMIGGWGRLLFHDPVARAHLAFLVFQMVSLFIGVKAFGDEGFVAGMYILSVTLSFLYVYVLGVFVGQNMSLDSIDQATDRSINLLAVAMIPTLAIGVMQLLTGTGRDVGGVMRIYGGTSSPNVLAAMLLVFAGLLMWTSRHRISIVRRGWIVLAVTLLIACFSLSGIISFVLMLGMYVVARARASGGLKIRFSWIVAGLVGVALIMYFADAVLSERFGELGQTDNSLTWRTRTWLSYLEFLRDPQFLLLGGGLGFDHLGLDQEPHNEWLRVLLETGLAGLFLFLRIWWKLLKSMSFISKSADPLISRMGACGIAIMAGLMVWGAVDSVIRTAPSVLLFWAFAGLVVGISKAYYGRFSQQPTPAQQPERPPPARLVLAKNL